MPQQCAPAIPPVLLQQRDTLIKRMPATTDVDAYAMWQSAMQDIEARIAAAVHLMVGRRAYHKWTPAAKERMSCVVCGRHFAVRIDGQVRQHRCFS